jgi:hypothetical protein
VSRKARQLLDVFGVVLLIGGLSALLDHQRIAALEGYIGGAALIVVSEWWYWRNGKPG